MESIGEGGESIHMADTYSKGMAKPSAESNNLQSPLQTHPSWQIEESKTTHSFLIKLRETFIQFSSI